MVIVSVLMSDDDMIGFGVCGFEYGFFPIIAWSLKEF